MSTINLLLIYILSMSEMKEPQGPTNVIDLFQTPEAEGTADPIADDIFKMRFSLLEEFLNNESKALVEMNRRLFGCIVFSTILLGVSLYGVYSLGSRYGWDLAPVKESVFREPPYFPKIPNPLDLFSDEDSADTSDSDDATL